jgi:DNA-binding LacI/PurR family transcriptional regulator
VQVDAVAGIRSAVKHLVSLGHRRIAFIGPRQKDAGWVSERVDGFLIAARAYGIAATEMDVIYPSREIGFSDTPSNPGYRCGVDAAKKMLSGQSYTAVVAANDFVAIGILDAAASLGVRVPEDLSVVGYDDVEESGFCSLTTVHRPASAVGVEAAAHIIRRLNAPQSDVRNTDFVAPILIVRASTRRLDV